MKYFIFILALLFAWNVQADQRFETWQNLCHFSYDPEDDDNEVYFSTCQNTIDTHDAQDGQGRLAYGTSTVRQVYSLPDLTIPKLGLGKLKGADADDTVYGDNYTSAPNTPCVMVTSNYDAGADDNNETVYVTNDWNLEILTEQVTVDLDTALVYKLDCRNGVAQ